jgi:hypothetical protein
MTRWEHSRRGRLRTVGLIGLIVVGAILAVVWGLEELPGWLRGGLLSSTTLLSAGIALVCLIGLIGMGWGLVVARRHRSSRALLGGEDGVAMIEFVLVFPFLLMLVLIMIQSTMLMVGNLIVHYSAHCGVRSAIVYVPDSVGLEGRNNPSASAVGSYKHQRIREAVLWALLPACPTDEKYAGGQWELVEGVDSIFRAYGEETPHWARTMLDRKMNYAEQNTTVKLDEPDIWYTNNVWGEYGEAELLRVRVEHTLYLGIPYAQALFAKMDRSGTSGGGSYGIRVYARAILTNEGEPDNVEVENFETPNG